ncbi:phosphodiester glycosidase family protein [Aureibacter tunicatorum]|uniref:Uncharacterized protein YigE (DUF2233 family) n=1 Tax=Aureibacter tunicatorum TaxID=866807 RepID=A0AAE3XR54_9BACT|nr:phosphodiester glycosidase family protein [Aureibacter tunicatorum]MDR6240494.1 uncharacterized protein YigE (DUF2233 family) [Aureibacter tunicatorum]BDD06643.1 hypothetical protein AUTU_41260 [Aureibacter tunicatorum]
MQRSFFFALLVVFSFCIVSFDRVEHKVDEDLFVLHEAIPKSGKLKFYWKDGNGRRFESLGNLRKHLSENGEKLIFAVNGGMYDSKRKPQGLYVEDGTVKQNLDTCEDGYGNFYMQPNGVFYLKKEGKAEIVSTHDFELDSTIEFATQSGPMLLINGEYHKKLMKGSANVHIRNGVGILPNGNALFAMSKDKVNFYDLATLFKQKGCDNALYLDGYVSRTFASKSNWEQIDGDFGVIIAEVE